MGLAFNLQGSWRENWFKPIIGLKGLFVQLIFLTAKKIKVDNENLYYDRGMNVLKKLLHNLLQLRA